MRKDRLRIGEDLGRERGLAVAPAQARGAFCEIGRSLLCREDPFGRLGDAAWKPAEGENDAPGQIHAARQRSLRLGEDDLAEFENFQDVIDLQDTALLVDSGELEHERVGEGGVL